MRLISGLHYGHSIHHLKIDLIMLQLHHVKLIFFSNLIHSEAIWHLLTFDILLKPPQPVIFFTFFLDAPLLKSGASVLSGHYGVCHYDVPPPPAPHTTFCWNSKIPIWEHVSAHSEQLFFFGGGGSPCAPCKISLELKNSKMRACLQLFSWGGTPPPHRSILSELKNSKISACFSTFWGTFFGDTSHTHPKRPIYRILWSICQLNLKVIDAFSMEFCLF